MNEIQLPDTYASFMYEIGRKGPLGPNQVPCETRISDCDPEHRRRRWTNLDESLPIAHGEEVPARNETMSFWQSERRETRKNALLEPVEERAWLVLGSHDPGKRLVGNSSVLKLGEDELVVSRQERAARNGSAAGPSFARSPSSPTGVTSCESVVSDLDVSSEDKTHCRLPPKACRPCAPSGCRPTRAPAP